MKLICLVGTRPEMIKVAPVVLKAQQQGVDVKLLSTGQHREMLRPLFSWFGLKPAWDLDLMQANQSLVGLSALVSQRVGEILEAEKPDWLIVQGDTTSAGAAAYAGFLSKTPVAHVEAGLRTYDIYSPFPEEFNRRWISLAASRAFAPTTRAAENLRAEALPHTQIHVVGNTGIDALLWSEQKLKQRGAQGMGLEGAVLVTLHRRENFGEPMRQLFLRIQKMAARGLKFLWPLHMNPQVRALALEIFGVPKDFNSNEPLEFKGVHFVSPLEYPSFIEAMMKAKFIITDSGGVQEEAPALGKPILVMRENTERPEAVEAGSALLLGQDLDRLEQLSLELSNEKSELYKNMSARKFPYGDGSSSEKILALLK